MLASKMSKVKLKQGNMCTMVSILGQYPLCRIISPSDIHFMYEVSSFSLNRIRGTKKVMDRHTDRQTAGNLRCHA